MRDDRMPPMPGLLAYVLLCRRVEGPGAGWAGRDACGAAWAARQGTVLGMVVCLGFVIVWASGRAAGLDIPFVAGVGVLAAFVGTWVLVGDAAQHRMCSHQLRHGPHPLAIPEARTDTVHGTTVVLAVLAGVFGALIAVLLLAD